MSSGSSSSSSGLGAPLDTSELTSSWNIPLLIMAAIASCIGTSCGLQYLKQITGRTGRRNWLRLIGASLSLGTTGAWTTQLIAWQARSFEHPEYHYNLPIEVNVGMSLAGEIVSVLCFMFAFWLLAGDGATQARLIGVAILCGCGVTAMLFLNANAMLLQATPIWSNVGIAISVIIGAFSLVLPLLLFFRFQSHFKLTVATHAISALFLALMILLVEGAVMASLSFVPAAALAAEHAGHHVDLSKWSWWALPAVCYSLFLLIAGCLVLNKTVSAETNKTRSLLLSALFFDNNNRVLTTIVGSLPSVEMDKVYVGAGQFGATNPDFLNMLKTSFDWRKANNDSILKLVQNRRRNYSLELYVKFVHAAEALARALKIPMSELGVIYWAPITLSSQYEGIMVTVTKRVHDASHYSSLGPFKWSSLDVIEPVIYENYTLQQQQLPLKRLPKSADAYTLTIDAPTPRGAGAGAGAIMNANGQLLISSTVGGADDAKEADRDEDEEVVLGGSWVRDMMAFNAACTTPLQPGLYLGIHYVKISGPRVEVMLSKQLLHQLPAVRITADHTAPSKAEWAWINSLSQQSTSPNMSDTASVSSDTGTGTTPPWQWSLSDTRRLSELDLAYGASAFSLGASASSPVAAPFTSTNATTTIGGISTSPASMMIAHHSGTTPHASSAVATNAAASSMLSSAPWMSNTLFASLTSAIDRRLSSAVRPRERDSLGASGNNNNKAPDVRHSSLTKPSPVAPSISTPLIGAVGTNNNNTIGLGTSGVRTPRTRSPNGTPMLSPSAEPHYVGPSLPPAEAALLRFQRSFLTAASDLATLLGTDVDLQPKNIYKKPVVVSIRGDVKMILLVVCKMAASFPVGYARDRLMFRPVNVFEAIHKSMHVFKQRPIVGPRARKAANALHSFRSVATVPHLLAVTTTFPGVVLHHSRPPSRPPTAQGGATATTANGRPLTATSLMATTLAASTSTTTLATLASGTAAGNSTYRATTITIPSSSIGGATRSTTPTHLFIRSGTTEPGGSSTTPMGSSLTATFTPSILTPTSISPLLSPGSLATLQHANRHGDTSSGSNGSSTPHHHGLHGTPTSTNGSVFPPKRRTLPAKGDATADAGLVTLAGRKLNADEHKGQTNGNGNGNGNGGSIAHHHSFPSPPHHHGVPTGTPATGSSLFTKTTHHAHILSPRIGITRVNGDEPTLTLDANADRTDRGISPMHSPLLSIATYGSPFPSPHAVVVAPSGGALTSSSHAAIMAANSASTTVTTTPLSSMASGRGSLPSDRDHPPPSRGSPHTIGRTISGATGPSPPFLMRSPDSRRRIERVIRAPRDSDDDDAPPVVVVRSTPPQATTVLVTDQESHMIRDREAKTELTSAVDDDDVAHPPSHVIDGDHGTPVAAADGDEEEQEQLLVNRKGTMVLDGDDDDDDSSEEDDDIEAHDREHDLSAREAEEAYERHSWLREIMETHLTAPDEKRREALTLHKLKNSIIGAGAELIRDRRHHLILHHDVLMGSQLVDWMIKNGHAYDRATAVLTGERLAELGLRHFMDAMPFKDLPTFYTFKPRDRSLASIPEMKDTPQTEQAAALARLSGTSDDVLTQSIRMTASRMSEHDVKLGGGAAALLEAVNNIMVADEASIINGNGAATDASSAAAIATINAHRRLRSHQMSSSPSHSKTQSRKSNPLFDSAAGPGPSLNLAGMDTPSSPASPGGNGGNGNGNGGTQPPAVARLSSRPGNSAVSPQQRVLTFVELKAVIMASPLVADRRVYLTTYPSSLIGSQLIDWLLVNGNAPDRSSAGIIAQELFDHHGLRHQPHRASETSFKDGNNFYTFLPVEGPNDRPPLLTRALSRLPGMGGNKTATPATPHRTMASISGIPAVPATPTAAQARKISSHSPHTSHGQINTATLTPPRYDRAISGAVTAAGAASSSASPPRSPQPNPIGGAALAAAAAAAAIAVAAAPSSSPFQFGRTLSTKPGAPSAAATKNGTGGHTRTLSRPPIHRPPTIHKNGAPAMDRFRSMSKPLVETAGAAASSTSTSLSSTSAPTLPPSVAASTKALHPGLPERCSSTEADITSSVIAHTRRESRVPVFARLQSSSPIPVPLVVPLVTATATTSLASSPQPLLSDAKGFPNRSSDRVSPPLVRPYFPPSSTGTADGHHPLSARDDNDHGETKGEMATTSGNAATTAAGVLPAMSSFDHGDFTINTSFAGTAGVPSLSSAPPHLSVITTASLPSSSPTAAATAPTTTTGVHPHQPSSPERKKMKPGRDTDGTGRAAGGNKDKAKQTLIKHVKGKASVQTVTAADIATDVAASGLFADRWRGLSSHKQCLIGSELVTWLMSRGYAWDRRSAVEIARRLAEYGLRSVSDANEPFADTDALFIMPSNKAVPPLLKRKTAPNLVQAINI